MANKQITFIHWCLKQASQSPVRERVMVYRQLALVTGEEAEAKRLQVLADELEAAENRCAELQFSLEIKGA